MQKFSKLKSIDYIDNPIVILFKDFSVKFANKKFKEINSNIIKISNRNSPKNCSLNDLLNLGDDDFIRIKQFIMNYDPKSKTNLYINYSRDNLIIKIYKFFSNYFALEMIKLDELSVIIGNDFLYGRVAPDKPEINFTVNKKIIPFEIEGMIEIFDSLEDLIHLTDNNYIVIYMNHAMKTIFGDGVGKRCYEVINGLDAPCTGCKMKLLSEGKSIRYEVYNKKGKYFDVINSPVFRQDGSFLKFSILRDITDLKNLEKQFKKEKNYFKRIIDNSIDGFFIIDRDTNIIDCNKAFLNIFKKENNAKDYLKLSKLVSKASKDTLNRKIKRVLKNSIPETSEIYVENGNIREYFLISLNPLQTDPQINHVYGLIKDISEIKRLQYIIETERNYNRNIIETVNLGFVLVDDQNKYLDYNRAYLDILGCDENDLEGKTFYDFTAAEYREFQEKLMEDMVKTKKSITFEKEFIRKDGIEVPVLLTMSRLYDQDGRAVGTFAFIKDISEEKIIKKELIEKNIRILNLIDIYNNISENFLICENINEVYKVINESIAKIIKADYFEILKKEHSVFKSLFPKMSITDGRSFRLNGKVSPVIIKLLKEKRAIFIKNISTELESEDTQQFPGLLNCISSIFIPVLQKNEVGGIIILSFKREIHEIDEIILNILMGISNLAFITIEKITSINEKIEIKTALDRHERLTVMGRITAGVAHEINNPLSIMQLDLDELKSQIEENKYTAPTIRELVKSMQEEIKRMSGIIAQLKDYSKPDMFEDEEILFISDILKAYPIKILLKNIKKKGIEVSTILIEKGLIKISRNRFIQVMMNVLNNADEAISDKKNGKIVIETSRVKKDRQVVIISISDNGTGISSNNISRIFEPFFTTKKSEGTGLGLSISYSIIKSYNGEIKVKSEYGKGSDFRIIFPECIESSL